MTSGFFSLVSDKELGVESIKNMKRYKMSSKILVLYLILHFFRFLVQIVQLFDGSVAPNDANATFRVVVREHSNNMQIESYFVAFLKK